MCYEACFMGKSCPWTKTGLAFSVACGALSWHHVTWFSGIPQDSDGRWHIVRMHEHFHFRNHLCIVFELLSINLYELIKGNGFRGFGLATIK